MKKRILSLSVFLLFACCVASVNAHPLGNFSINQYSRLEVENRQIKIRQILDLAEIPTFQERATIDADRDGAFSGEELRLYVERLTPQVLSNLSLTIDDQPLEIRADATAADFRLEDGAGNLPTLKIAWNFVADLLSATGQSGVNRIKFENRNYGERAGWNEIVVGRAGGIQIFDSTAFGSGVTDELKAYPPPESLAAPLHERTAEFSVSLGGALPANSKPLQNRDGHETKAASALRKDRLAELIDVPEITPAVILFGLLLAFGLGAMHAMSPGHGKTVVGAYLVGSRGTAKHAVFLGLTVTITHTLGVFALGLLTLFASNYVLPEKIMPFLNFVSGLLVFFIGISLFKDRLFAALGLQSAEHHHHHHHHEAAHDHSQDSLTHTHDGHTHSHLPPEEISWKSLLGLGISGGLLPCPSALVLMLSAISLGRVGYGLILTLVFSLGLAANLTAVGLIFLYAGKAFGASRLAKNRLVKTVPVFSALVIAVVGAIICYNSLAL